MLLPLLEHFVFNKADDDSADNLAGETIRTLAALVEWLEWPQFRSLFKRYIGYLTSKEDMQKAIVRLIGGLMDGLNQAGRKNGYVTASQPAADDVEEGSETVAVADADAMDVDDEAKPANVPKTATLAPGSTLQPKKTVDLESMAFSQGGHLMSNKKCKLPEGSFKRAKKGYEEIHVPAPKQKTTAASDLVPIADLPAWAREAFPGTKSLNRVQSKLYPVAFGTDEPILLCAPTGAGKVGSLVILLYRDLNNTI